jgi:hypothetical protein
MRSKLGVAAFDDTVTEESDTDRSALEDQRLFAQQSVHCTSLV